MSSKKKQKAKAKLSSLSSSGLSIRSAATTEIKKQILVVGEGEHTEPSYFKKFREPGVKVVAKGLGKGTCKLVNEVEKIKNQQEQKLNIQFDEIWVAFDKDDFDDFEQAIADAKNKGYKVAYSNQAIEYWFLLHLKNHQGQALSRKEYAKELNELLPPNIKYDPDSKEISQEQFEFLYGKIQDAFDRASNIFEYKNEHNLPTEESVTTVHQLVGNILGLKTTKERRQAQEMEDSKKKAKS